MPSISFDPVAHVYDATRGYPIGIPEQLVQGITQAANATAQTTFLEVGVGTGRIALPLASLGHTYTGVDISQKMVEQLEAKLREQGWQEQEQPWGALPDEDTAIPSEVHRFVRLGQEPPASMRLVMGDITKLPFIDGAFDVAVAVHIFHLVDGWQQSVSETLRVIRSGGLFLHCWDEFLGANPVEEQWREILHELGAEVNRPGAHTRSDVTQWLQDQGLEPQELHIAQWQQVTTVRRALEQVTKRLWSGTWGIPDDVFQTSVQRLSSWVDAHFAGQLDTPRNVTRQFVISKTVL